MVGILSVFAQLERETILERTRIGRKNEQKKDCGMVQVTCRLHMIMMKKRYFSSE